jgi:hypothetical protein
MNECSQQKQQQVPIATIIAILFYGSLRAPLDAFRIRTMNTLSLVS